jgi:hypothetical protein
VSSQEVQDPPALLDVVLGVGAQAMHKVRELHPISDEKHLSARQRMHRVRMWSVHIELAVRSSSVLLHLIVTAAKY